MTRISTQTKVIQDKSSCLFFKDQLELIKIEATKKASLLEHLEKEGFGSCLVLVEISLLVFGPIYYLE